MAAASETVTIPATGVYQVDPARSAITFRTRHMFGLGPVNGSFSIRTGNLTVADPVTDSLVTAAIETSSFSTGNSQRDAQVRSAAFLDAANHPEIVFVSTGLARTERGWVLRGEITARGVVAPVELLLVDVVTDGDDVGIHATGTVDRYAHGITKLKGMAGRRLDLDITARAVRA